MSDPVSPVIVGAGLGLVLGTFIVVWVLIPVWMYRHHLKARRRAAETAPDGMPAVPDSCGKSEAA